MESIHSYIQKNQSQFLADLSAFLSIPSISTQPEHKKEVETCAIWLKNYLKKIGLGNCQLIKTTGHPVVFAQYYHPKNINTLLIYGHYDVQPVEPLDEWKSPPFKPEIKHKKIYGRGTSDNKGQLFINIWALKYFLDQKINPGINIKYIIEGEEESGGKNLESFIKRHKRLLKSNLAFISDSSMLSKTQSTISYGTRGIVYFELEIAGPKHDIHSGTYGGIIQNPTNALARIISHMQNDDGELLISGFEKNIRLISKEEKVFLQKQVTKKDIIRDTGVSELLGNRNLSVEEIVGAKPSLDVHGIWGGFRKQGEKTIIPDKVTCKLSIRTVPFMTAKDVIEKFTDFVRNVKPRGVKTKINVLSYCEPYWMDYKSILIRKASDIIYDGLKVYPMLSLEGGSIPAPTYFKKHLNIETLLLGYGLPDDNLHAPNEKMDLSQFWKGIKTSINLYQKIFN